LSTRHELRSLVFQGSSAFKCAGCILFNKLNSKFRVLGLFLLKPVYFIKCEIHLSLKGLGVSRAFPLGVPSSSLIHFINSLRLHFLLVTKRAPRFPGHIFHPQTLTSPSILVSRHPTSTGTSQAWFKIPGSVFKLESVHYDTSKSDSGKPLLFSLKWSFH
jgi:hypothetical protein